MNANLNKESKGFLVYKIVIAAVGGFFLISSFSHRVPSEVAALPSSHEKIIYIDEKGFSPKELVIEAGETVIFINRGRDGHWPASDLHPTHQIYPEFDPEKPIPPGGEWSFRFTKEGEWKMHDHIFPNLRGKITVLVVGATESTPNQKTKAKLPIPPKDIIQQLATVDMIVIAKKPAELRRWMEIAGPKILMEDLLTDSGNGGAIDCHQEAHYIGRLAYELYGAAVFKNGNALCHSGFYHGAIEEFLKEEGTTEITKKAMNLCALFDTSFGRFSCLHGIGHGLLAFEDYDLPKAIKLCQELSTPFEKSSCLGGVFMENIITAQGFGAAGAHKTDWVKRNDPHFPCNKLSSDSTVLNQCYMMQTSWMLTIFNYNFDQVVAECRKAPESMISVCFQSIGRDAAGNSLRSIPKILEICGKVKDNIYYNNCLVGALNVIVDFWGEELSDQATELCRAVPNEGKARCYETLAYRLSDIFDDKRKATQICAGFEKNYRDLCN